MRNFLFFGTGGLLSSICLDHISKCGFRPAVVFIQKNNSTLYPNLTEQICINENLAYHSIESIDRPETIELISSYTPEYAIIASFGEIFKKPIIGSFPIYNVHMGVLPEYRGAYTNFWKIMSDHDKYGVTIHEIDEKIDSGSAILIKEKNFSSVVFASHFFRLNYEMAAEALEEVLIQIQNNSLSKSKLSTESGKYYKKHKECDMLLDPLEDTIDLYKKINRLQFYGNPTLLNYKIFECSLLYHGKVDVDLYETTKVSENSFILKNKSGIVLLKHL